MTQLRFQVQRPLDEYGQTIGIIEATFSQQAMRSGIGDDAGLLSTLTEAMTEWVRTTEEGQRFWESTGRDANIGDLISAYDGGLPDAVEEALRTKGILGFRARCISNDRVSQVWSYDTLIVEHDALDGVSPEPSASNSAQQPAERSPQGDPHPKVVNPEQSVLIVGNVIDGLTLYGPFDDANDAGEYADAMRIDDTWVVAPMTVAQCDEDGQWPDPESQHEVTGAPRQPTAGMIGFRDEACETLQDLIDNRFTGYTARAVFADGAEKDVQIQPTPQNPHDAHGMALVRDWSEHTDQAAGDPYWIDLYGTIEGVPHVTSLAFY